jgi:ornithine cyclodeaminase/alanine dehydrogenase-like protein (mu-crystallin family)
MTQAKKTPAPKVTIIGSKGADQAINYLLEDRHELEWLVAVGRTRDGDIIFYDSGGDIIQDLGALEYVKERILRDYFGDTED